MRGREISVHVAQVILAELAGRVAMHLEQVGNCGIFGVKSDIRS
jgi:hypothetical protein